MTSAMASEMTWISFSRSTHAMLQQMVLELLVACTRISHPCQKHTTFFPPSFGISFFPCQHGPIRVGDQLFPNLPEKTFHWRRPGPLGSSVVRIHFYDCRHVCRRLGIKTSVVAQARRWISFLGDHRNLGYQAAAGFNVRHCANRASSNVLQVFFVWLVFKMFVQLQHRSFLPAQVLHSHLCWGFLTFYYWLSACLGIADWHRGQSSLRMRFILPCSTRYCTGFGLRA